MGQNFRLRFLTSIGISLGSIFFVLAVIFYLGFDIVSKSNLISESQAKTLSLINAAGSFTSLKEQDKLAEPAFAKLRNALPNRDSLFSVSRDLSNLARQDGLSFSSKFGDEIPATETKPSLIRIEMVTQGNDSDTIKFMKDVEGSNYFINIVSFDIIRQGARFSSIIDGQVFFSK